MILVADDGQEISFLSPGEAQLGESVKPEGHTSNATAITYDEFKKIDINKLKDMVVVDCKNLFEKAGSVYMGLGK